MQPEQLLELLEFNQYNFDVILSYIFGYLAILWFLFCLWVLKDINSRTNNVFIIALVVIFVLIFNIPGLVLYLMLRPEKTLEEARALDLYQISQLEDNLVTCAECRSIIRKNYNYCTVCGSSLYSTCDYCGKQINPIWVNCGFCGERIDFTNKEIYNYRKALFSVNYEIFKIKLSRKYNRTKLAVYSYVLYRYNKIKKFFYLFRLQINKRFSKPMTIVSTVAKGNVEVRLSDTSASSTSEEKSEDSLNSVVDVISLLETRKKKEKALI